MGWGSFVALRIGFGSRGSLRICFHTIKWRTQDRWWRAPM